MQLIETERDEYLGRVVAIRTWIHDVGHELVGLDFSVEVDGELLAFIRTSHTVRIGAGGGEEAVVLTKEEFWNEYNLFERSAAAKLRAAIERLSIR